MRNIAGNLTMLVDFYEITMGNGYLKCGMQDTVTYFGAVLFCLDKGE